MMLRDTWRGCAWVLALALYPLTMLGWWLRNSGGSMRTFDRAWWRRVRRDLAILIWWIAGLVLGSLCW